MITYLEKRVSIKHDVSAVVRVHQKEKECPKCSNEVDILSFGIGSAFLTSESVAEETFFWCPCGYKWIN